MIRVIARLRFRMPNKHTFTVKMADHPYDVVGTLVSRNGADVDQGWRFWCNAGGPADRRPFEDPAACLAAHDFTLLRILELAIVQCRNCHGHGYSVEIVRNEAGHIDTSRGRRRTCTTCRGRGRVEEEKEIWAAPDRPIDPALKAH